jgi:hypothetical protein
MLSSGVLWPDLAEKRTLCSAAHNQPKFLFPGACVYLAEFGVKRSGIWNTGCREEHPDFGSLGYLSESSKSMF